MRLSVLRGAGLAVVGAIALCMPTSMGGTQKAIDNTKVANKVTSEPVRPVVRQAVPGLRDKVAGTRFEFGVPDDARKQTGRVAPATRAGTGARDVEPTPGAPVTLPASAAPGASVGVRVHGAPKLSVAGIRALQRELKRLGCYSGQIDGDWGPASRSAAATFASAVNAALPVDKPEPVLLALARQKEGSYCEIITNGSVIIAASRTPTTGTPVITRAAGPDYNKGTRDWSGTVTLRSPYASDPPRIVRPSGMQITGGAQASIAGREINGVGYMALGAEPASGNLDGRDASAKAERLRRSRPKSNAARRAPQRNWKRQVFRSINLDGG